MALLKNIITGAFIPVAQVSYKRVPYQDQPEPEDPIYTRRLQEVLFNIILTHSCNATNLEQKLEALLFTTTLHLGTGVYKNDLCQCYQA